MRGGIPVSWKVAVVSIALLVVFASLSVDLDRSAAQVEEVDCGILASDPPGRLDNPLHWHQSRVANLTMAPFGKLQPLIQSDETAQYFEHGPTYGTSPTPDSDDWATFNNIEVNGSRRDERWNYIDQAGVVYQLISPPKSKFHQPDTTLWVDDGAGRGRSYLFSRPPVDAPQLYPNRKFVTFPDHNGRSFEIVMLPDNLTSSEPYRFTKQSLLINHPLQGTFNWADDAVSGEHFTLDVVPHRDVPLIWPEGDEYQPVALPNILRVEGPMAGESLYDNGIEQMAWLAEVAENVDLLQSAVTVGSDLVDVPEAVFRRPIRVLRRQEGSEFRYRLIDRDGDTVVSVLPEVNHALIAYLDSVGLSCTDGSAGSGGSGSGGVEINTPAPCRDPDYESPLTDNRFFPTCPDAG